MISQFCKLFLASWHPHGFFDCSSIHSLKAKLLSRPGLLLLRDDGVGSGVYSGNEWRVKRYFSGSGDGSFLNPDPNIRKKLGILWSLK